MVVFELVKGLLELLGANGTLALGTAFVLVGVYYSREVSAFLARVASIVSLSAVLLGGVGLAVVVGVSMGWLSIDVGAVEGLLRSLGGIIK